MSSELNIKALVESEFRKASIEPVSIQIRSFPGEVIAIVEVDRDYERALAIAQKLDLLIENGFVTVRQVAASTSKKFAPVANVHDPKVADLLRLLNARSRTSESQPSLRYIQDVGERLSLAVSARHHLIFGRRGVGKTALLLEAKRVLETSGNHVLWVNIQSLRSLSTAHAFITVALRICDLVLGAYEAVKAPLNAIEQVSSLRAALEQRSFLSVAQANLDDVALLVPHLQQVCARFCLSNQSSLYLFLDDIHYLSSNDVPKFLDLLHGVTRDSQVWLKVAGIQHQTRWFIPAPPIGLQTGHDATIINLDVTLEHPEKAKKFLESVLKVYVDECTGSTLSKILSPSALDRLVLASGGVPRDFMTLCAASLQTARQRPNAQTVGVQDVNNVAGIAGQTKLQELEDDAAATSGRSQVLLDVLQAVRNFVLVQEQITFFRVGLRDKEQHPVGYRSLQALADMRMLHLINNSLSDQHQAGQRFEVYLLDLSQYSGARLKQNLRVLDFERGHIVLKKTRSADPVRAGNTSLKLVSLLRNAPVFELQLLDGLAAGEADI